MSSTLLRSKAGGIITEYDGRKVERVSDLPRAVAVPSWARPGPGPAVTENGCYVIYAPRRAPGPRCSNSIYHRADRTWAADLLARGGLRIQVRGPHGGRAGLQPARARHRVPLQPARGHEASAQSP